jgi:hypothetical protein
MDLGRKSRVNLLELEGMNAACDDLGHTALSFPN